MSCISSPALDDAKIVSFIDGEAEAAVVEHLKECAFCAEKANRWSNLQNNLRARLYRRTCPTSMELGEYPLGLLSASQALLVAQHVRECPLCRRELNELRDYMNELSPTGETGLLGGLKVLIARWVGGNPEGTPSMSPALRGAGKGPITFEADGLVIVLDIQATSEGRVSVLGQVAADEQDQWTDAVVELRQVDRPSITASVDDLGAFRFEEARIGSTEITITSLNGMTVQIPNFDLTT